MPRLVNRSGVRRSQSQVSGGDLPPFESASCPLNDLARRELGAIANDRKTHTYKQYLLKSIDLLGNTIDNLFERQNAQQSVVRAKKRKRDENGHNPTIEDQKLEQHFMLLDEQVHLLGKRSEAAIRQVLDCQSELQDEGDILSDLYTISMTDNVMTINQSTLAPNHLQDVEADTQSLYRDYDKARAVKANAYSNLTVFQRYAQNNDYINFKRIWHDAAVGEEGPPLPNADRWFDLAMQPVLFMSGAQNYSGTIQDGYAEDDDFAIEREVLSLKCPLTLQSMEEPFSNKRCKHTFERAAMLEYLENGGEKQCPQTGCAVTFDKVRWDNEFYFDKAIMRKIERARKVQARQDVEDSEDDRDASLAEVRQRKGGRRPNVKNERRKRATSDA